MTKTSLVFFWVFVFGTLILPKSFAADFHLDDFHPEVNDQMQKESFWAEISFDEGSTATLAEFRAWYPFPADRVFPVLIDTNNFPKVHSNYENAMTLTQSVFDEAIIKNPKSAEELEHLIVSGKQASAASRKKEATWDDFVYLNFNFPWPLSNRWTLQEVHIDETKATQGVYRFDYKMRIGNFKTLSGYWELVPIEGKPGWTEFRGAYRADPGIPLPKFVTKAAAKTSLKKDFEDNKKVLGQDR